MPPREEHLRTRAFYSGGGNSLKYASVYTKYCQGLQVSRNTFSLFHRVAVGSFMSMSSLTLELQRDFEGRVASLQRKGIQALAAFSN